MTISPEMVRSVIATEDDFAHEMKVSSILHGLTDYQVTHGGTYTDSVTGKPRQYDFHATLRRDDAELFLPIECKRISENAPLVVSGCPRAISESFHDLLLSRVGTVTKGSVTAHGLSSATLRARRKDSIYRQGCFTGKSLLRLSTKGNGTTTLGDSDVYDKWSQALSSAVEVIHGACMKAHYLHKKEYYTSVLPIVVLPNDSLWQCEYDTDGKMAADPKRVDDCPFFVGRSHRIGIQKFEHEFVISHLHFCTIRGLEARLAAFAKDKDAWADFMTIRAIEQ